jgi:hypothetical protein
VGWHFFFDRSVAQHFGIAKLDQNRTFRIVGVIAGDADWSQFIGLTVTASDKCGHLGLSDSFCANAEWIIRASTEPDLFLALLPIFSWRYS